MHGTGDDVVNVKAGFELVEQFMALNDCSIQPTTNSKAFQNNDAVTKLTYSNKLNEERVFFYEFSKWGHFVPVDPGSGLYQGGQTGMFAKDVDFFSTFWILNDWGLIKL
jgi:poly(3-hydroxybutyrate) depolymerase